MNGSHFAALSGHQHVLEWLAVSERAGSDSLLAKTGAGMSPLHLASMKGHISCVEWLVASGNADPNSTDTRGRTPLHLAVAGSHAPLASWLIRAGADPRAPDSDGKTPFALAQALASSASAASVVSSTNVVDVLNIAMAPPSPPGAPSRLTADQAESLGMTLKLPQIDNVNNTSIRVWLRWAEPDTPLSGMHAEAYSLQFTPVKSSSFFGVGVTAPRDATLVTINDDDNNVIIETHGSETNDIAACIDTLTPATAYTFRVRARNQNGWGQYSAKSEEISTTAAAVIVPVMATVIPVVAASVTPTSTTASLPTPVNDLVSPVSLLPASQTLSMTSSQTLAPLLDGAVEAAASGDIDALTLMSTNTPGSLEGISTDGRTLLHIAAATGVATTASFLLSDSAIVALVDTRDARGCTALLLAIVGGYVGIAKNLASRGASLNIPDSAGFTPIHYAVLRGRAGALRWLLEAGADASARNLRGQTPREALEAKGGNTGTSLGNENISNTGDAPSSIDTLISLLSNANSVPIAPPVPVLLESSLNAVALVLPLPRWAAGSPAPFGYQVQVCKRSGLSALVTDWKASVDAAPTGINVCAASFATVTGSPRDIGAPPTLAFTPVVVMIQGLEKDTRYAVQLRARSALGMGAWSPRSADFSTLSSLPANVTLVHPFSTETEAAIASTALASEAMLSIIRVLTATAAYAARAHAAIAAGIAACALLRPPSASIMAVLRGERVIPPQTTTTTRIPPASTAGNDTSVTPPPSGTVLSSLLDASRCGNIDILATSQWLDNIRNEITRDGDVWGSRAEVLNVNTLINIVCAAASSTEVNAVHTIRWLCGITGEEEDAKIAAASAIGAIVGMHADTLTMKNTTTTDPDVSVGNQSPVIAAAALAGSFDVLKLLYYGAGGLEALLNGGVIHLLCLRGHTEALNQMILEFNHSSTGSSSTMIEETMNVGWAGSGIEADERSGWTPLHWAAVGGATGASEIVTILLSHNALPGACDTRGRTPAHIAALTDSPAFLKSLPLTCILSPRDIGGLAPLHYAAASGAGGALAFLLWAAADAGANDVALDIDSLGRTPGEIAAETGRRGVFEALSAWGERR